MLRSQGEDLIRESNNLPLLSSYSSDGTPLKTHRRIPLKSASGPKTRRSGQQPVEVLVQNQYLRCFDGGGAPRSVAVIQDPVPFTRGRSGAALFACAKEMCL
eukprot:11214688-Lingulodinium_polyedra.AAC.1